MDQTKGEKESGPHTDDEEKDLICQLNNASILAETKIEIMQCVVAKCPKVCIRAHGIQILSLLDSSSESDTASAVVFQQTHPAKN